MNSIRVVKLCMLGEQSARYYFEVNILRVTLQSGLWTHCTLQWTKYLCIYALVMAFTLRNVNNAEDSSYCGKIKMVQMVPLRNRRLRFFS